MAFVSGCCEGERCHCGKPAEHKVEETIFDDDPHQGRHPFTTYICHEHFVQMMGPAAEQYRRLEEQGAWPVTPPPGPRRTVTGGWCEHGYHVDRGVLCPVCDS